MYNNVVNGEKCRKYAATVLKNMRDVIGVTIGPEGKNTIDATDEAGILITKDGFNSINRIHYNDPIANTYASLFKDLSRSLVSAVGDGSTTCLVAAYHLYNQIEYLLHSEEFSNLRPKAVSDLISKIVKEIVSELKKNSKSVTDNMEEIKNIAAVSLNNNEDIGNMIYEIYNKIGLEGFITVNLGNGVKTEYETKDGFMIQQGRMDESFVNNNNNESELYDSAVLIFGKAVNDKDSASYCFETMKLVKKCVEEYGDKSKYKSTTIIAPGFGRDIVEQLRALVNEARRYNVKINFNLIQYSLATEYDRELLYDIALMTNGAIITNNETENNKLDFSLKKSPENSADKFSTLGDYIGYAGKIISGKKVTTFYNSDENKTLLEVEKGRIRDELREVESDPGMMTRRYELRKRLAIINKKVVKINVGGIDETSRLNDKELIDDAVSACRSAIEFGYAQGCNLPIIKSCESLLEDRDNETETLLLNAIRVAFINVYRDILSNKFGCTFEELSSIECEDIDTKIQQSINENKVYNLITKEFTDTEIISPSETDVKVLEHATSIISLIISSNQMIVRNTTEEIKFIDEE